MSSPRSARPQRSRATRERILAAAERHFAERGFSEARLEDIAADVGVRRAAIFYYFRDKRELYEATLQQVFDDFTAASADARSAHTPVGQRLLDGLSSWIDFLYARPSVARLILREAADAPRGVPSPIANTVVPLVKELREWLAAGVDSGELAPQIEAFDFISSVGATTIFQLSALPALTPDAAPGPEDRERHKRDMLRLARIMLGMD